MVVADYTGTYPWADTSTTALSQPSQPLGVASDLEPGQIPSPVSTRLYPRLHGLALLYGVRITGVPRCRWTPALPPLSTLLMASGSALFTLRATELSEASCVSTSCCPGGGQL